MPGSEQTLQGKWGPPQDAGLGLGGASQNPDRAIFKSLELVHFKHCTNIQLVFKLLIKN